MSNKNYIRDWAMRRADEEMEKDAKKYYEQGWDKLYFIELPGGTATVDRRNEYIGDDSCVEVELPCGFEAKFWLTGLSSDEYIRRTQEMKRLGI